MGEFYKSMYDDTSEFFNQNKIRKLIQTDFSYNFLSENPYPNKIIMDEENIPFKNNSFDIIISNLYLHNVNDPSSVLKKLYDILKPNGAIILTIPALGTLNKLSESLFETEMKTFSGISPRIHPFPSVEVLGNLVQSSGFKEITVDKDEIEIMYKDFNQIFKDLQHSAQNNILTNRNKKFVGKNFFKKVQESYEKHKDIKNNCYPVTVEFANLIAWKS